MTPEYRAMKAQQLQDDEVLTEAFAAIEARALRDAIAVPAWHGAFGDRKRRRLLEKVKIISELRSELVQAIAAGKQAARPRSGVA